MLNSSDLNYNEKKNGERTSSGGVKIFIKHFINSSIYLMNDVLAFTISPWYNAKERQRLIKQEAIYATEVAHVH